MLKRLQAKQVHQIVAQMQRSEIIQQMRRCPAHFPIDFTDAWFSAQSTAELRHIFAAICIQSDVMPAEPVRSSSDRAA